MSLITKIASKFVFDRKASAGLDPSARGFVSFISSVSVTGLALGVTALLVVTSVMNGFERELKQALTAFHGHVLLFSRGEPISDPENFLKQIPREFPDVTGVSPYFYIEAMLSSSKAVAGTVVEGVHLPTLSSVSQIGNRIIEGRLVEKVASGADPEITLGYEVARKLKVTAGDSIVLTIPFAGSKGGDATTPLVKRLKVVGIVKIGMYDYDNKYTVMEISDLQSVLGLSGKVNAFKILTKEPLKSSITTDAMNEKYVYPLRARDWSSLNRNLFYAIQLEKWVISIVLLSIVLVASFNIISTLMMLVHDKKRQISMLKALGFSSKSTLGVFLLIGFGMAVLGVILGAGFGRALCAVLQWKSIIDLPPDVYGLSRLPIEIRGIEWAGICGFVVVLALLSTVIPSVRVSRQEPADGLRYE